jgi:hypothetical protein
MPPALSQSVWVVYFEKLELGMPDGLAEGVEVPLPVPMLGAPGAVVAPPLLGAEPVPDPDDPSDVPDAPEPAPDGPLPPLPLPVCAAASAGASAIDPTKSAKIAFRIVSSSVVGLTFKAH